jgi:hypothetical protein
VIPLLDDAPAERLVELHGIGPEDDGDGHATLGLERVQRAQEGPYPIDALRNLLVGLDEHGKTGSNLALTRPS